MNIKLIKTFGRFWYKLNAKVVVLLLIGNSLISCSTNRAALNKTNEQLTSRMHLLISIMKSDLDLHKGVEKCVTDKEIKSTESDFGLQLPSSYKYFLKEFGNGAEWLYHIDHPINGINKEYGKIHWLGEFRNYLEEITQSDGFGTYKTNSLLCLMTDSSNGGAWCWITTEHDENGEWPLAFFNINDRKLYFKLANFEEWLSIAAESKGEVIRALDQEYKLDLG